MANNKYICFKNNNTSCWLTVDTRRDRKSKFDLIVNGKFGVFGSFSNTKEYYAKLELMCIRTCGSYILRD